MLCNPQSCEIAAPHTPAVACEPKTSTSSRLRAQHQCLLSVKTAADTPVPYVLHICPCTPVQPTPVTYVLHMRPCTQATRCAVPHPCSPQHPAKGRSSRLIGPWSTGQVGAPACKQQQHMLLLFAFAGAACTADSCVQGRRSSGRLDRPPSWPFYLVWCCCYRPAHSPGCVCALLPAGCAAAAACLACRPARGDWVGLVGETLGDTAVRAMAARMRGSPTGRQILAERPRVTVS
jgi:hypothetical protein